MILADLPSEILGQILHSQDVSTLFIALWICGNRLLVSKLASGITFVHMEKFLASSSFFPPVISELRHLRYLYLHSEVTDPKRWTKAILSLPPTLEALHLVSKHCLVPFIAVTPECLTSDYSRGPTHFIDIGAIFPRLDTLEINFDDTRSAISSHSLAILSALPSTLTRLIGGNLFVDTQHVHLASMLPRSLKRLEMLIRCSPDLNSSFFDNWAESLPNLEYIYGISAKNHPDNLSWAPRSLTEGGFVGSNRTLNLSPSVSPFFPPMLSSLVINEIDIGAYCLINKPWASDLPRNLTSLELRLRHTESTLPSQNQLFWQQIAYLPRSLQRLYLFAPLNFDWDSIESQESLSWPPNLTFLRHSACFPEHYKLLPKTLKSLELNLRSITTAYEYHIDANNFPSSLTDLRFIVSTGTVSIYNDLPKLLTILEFADYSGGSVTGCITNETLEKIGALPSLTSFDLRLRDTPGIDFVSLPPSLVNLRISKWHAHRIGDLPKSLTILNIDALLLPVDDQSGIVDCFSHLPPGLNLFQVTNVRNMSTENKLVFSSDNAPHLSQLNSFDVPYGLVFSSNFIRRLPRTMKRLRLTLETIEEKDAPFLPVLMESCFIRSINPMKPYVAEYWPLRSLDGIPNEIADRVRQRNASKWRR